MIRSMTLVLCAVAGLTGCVPILIGGADLLFHTAMGGVAQYATAITSLASAGADVLVDDLFYLNEPMFQDGVVAQAVDSVVAGGAAYFSAAGNAARNSYEAGFVDSGEDLCLDLLEPIGVCDPVFELVGDMHDFDPGPGSDFFLPDNLELAIGTDPLLVDTDGDGLSDFEEVAWDGNASAYSPGLDLDPLAVDTDLDGFRDGMEVAAEHNPLDGTDSRVWSHINDDGSVDARDVLLASRAVLGLSPLSGPQKARGNVAPLVNGQPQSLPDDAFTLADLLLIQSKALAVLNF